MSQPTQASQAQLQKDIKFNKSEKTKDIRLTNIQAAKGKNLRYMKNCILYNKNKFGIKRNGQNDIRCKR
ncbi:unnamed protein product [Paramecium sonneborni]|uniref:Uncharacterized protein n=1 Tax=Paramecium sonneborni TaxID=65129 RepID=A0A8S1MBH3_9CILI|nr:unnamed protein product [Paramecium sonneborni]